MLKYRLMTAAVLIPLTLLVLFYLPPTAFFIMTTIVLLGGAWEWAGLMGLTAKSSRFIYTLVILMLMGWSLFIPTKIIFIAAFGWWMIATVLVMIYPVMSDFWGSGLILRGLIGILVLLPCWVAINIMRHQLNGPMAVLFLFILVWGADSAAYFVGRKWGKTKLAPMVSPGKSREGVVGALLFTMLIALVVVWLSGMPASTWPWAMGLSIVTVIFSIVGDLFESMMKRKIGVKDSGNLLPGHGGILDRIDSLTAAAPIFVLGGLAIGTHLS